MSLRYRTLDASITQTDMAMNRTARENAGRLGIGCVSAEVLIRTIRRGKVKKICGSSSIRIGWTDQNFGRGKLITHAHDVWRILVVIIERPNPDGESELLQIIDAHYGSCPFTGLVQGGRFLRRQRRSACVQPSPHLQVLVLKSLELSDFSAKLFCIRPQPRQII